MYLQSELFPELVRPCSPACDEYHFNAWLEAVDVGILPLDEAVRLTKLEMHRVAEAPAPHTPPRLPQPTVGRLICCR